MHSSTAAVDFLNVVAGDGILFLLEWCAMGTVRQHLTTEEAEMAADFLEHCLLWLLDAVLRRSSEPSEASRKFQLQFDVIHHRACLPSTPLPLRKAWGQVYTTYQAMDSLIEGTKLSRPKIATETLEKFCNRPLCETLDEKGMMQCARCHRAYYCSQQCQKL
ncbi:hypothetical protein DL93DRAFT_1420831 [Clavulina sp. PMI_390]|nr:hypothetical protein DL93DRAFT_1420831 [Clavulina sp. PMI_390]